MLYLVLSFAVFAIGWAVAEGLRSIWVKLLMVDALPVTCIFNKRADIGVEFLFESGRQKSTVVLSSSWSWILWYFWVFQAPRTTCLASFWRVSWMFRCSQMFVDFAKALHCVWKSGRYPVFLKFWIKLLLTHLPPATVPLIEVRSSSSRLTLGSRMSSKTLTRLSCVLRQNWITSRSDSSFCSTPVFS